MADISTFCEIQTKKRKKKDKGKKKEEIYYFYPYTPVLYCKRQIYQNLCCGALHRIQRHNLKTIFLRRSQMLLFYLSQHFLYNI